MDSAFYSATRYRFHRYRCGKSRMQQRCPVQAMSLSMPGKCHTIYPGGECQKTMRCIHCRLLCVQQAALVLARQFEHCWDQILGLKYPCALHWRCNPWQRSVRPCVNWICSWSSRRTRSRTTRGCSHLESRSRIPPGRSMMTMMFVQVSSSAAVQAAAVVDCPRSTRMSSSTLLILACSGSNVTKGKEKKIK